MTDQSDQQGGDRLLPAEHEQVLGFVSDASVAIHDEPMVVWVDSEGEWWGGLPQSFIKLSAHGWTVDRWQVLPTAEGAGDENPFLDDAIRWVTTSGTTATPQPAPDASALGKARTGKSATGAAEPVALRKAVEDLFAGGFVEAGLRGEPDEWKQVFEARTNVIKEALLVTHPVRGDREILHDAIMGAAKLHTHDHALALKIADAALLSLPVQPGAGEQDKTR